MVLPDVFEPEADTAVVCRRRGVVVADVLDDVSVLEVPPFTVGVTLNWGCDVDHRFDGDHGCRDGLGDSADLHRPAVSSPLMIAGLHVSRRRVAGVLRGWDGSRMDLGLLVNNRMVDRVKMSR